ILLFAVIFEDRLETKITGGESKDKTVLENGVVRHMQRNDVDKFNKEGRSSQSVSIKLNDKWKEDNLGVVVFLQDSKSLEILQSWGRYLKKSEDKEENKKESAKNPVR
ncbi:MAG: hypothetical protein HYY16_17290, partial [Planctomycetes bacterium]|nr:hypothetical protein [Planctomycetota bacterium]